MSDRIAIMDKGNISQIGSPTDIYEKPSNAFVADFIGSPSMNLINGNLIKEGDNFFFMCNNSDDKIKIPIINYNFTNKNINTCIKQ